MASTKDIHDIMGMGGGPVQKPANKKKKKIVEAQPRLSGISREVQALMGDSVPPVQIVETPKYKSKPTLASKLYKPRHWDERTFTPGARTDGLALRHWKRALPLQRPPQTNGDVDMVDGEKDHLKPDYTFEDEFPMEKWAVNIKVPEYTDELYDRHFKTDDWTREETDYLMRITSEYDLRWHLIADRYDPLEIQPPTADTEGMDIARNYSPRTMEQLKLRYYQVAAQDLELKTPKSTMNPTEFALWEKMRNFDAKTEGLRKTMAEKLFERTKDEAEEERTLLEELQRITKNEDDFINMRRDLYARLEAAPSLRRNERGEEQNIVLSSAGLSDLLSRLFAKEKHSKRRVPAPGEQSATQQHSAVESRGRSNTIQSRRDTIDTPNEPTKKGSISHQPQQKQLTKEQEEKYGVSHPTEKLTSGVSFRHEKINRITTAKSQVQTQKVIQALNELQIPARLSMPTEKVCKEFERLVGQIQILLDCRKTLGRVSEEVKILEEMRRQRLGEPASTDQAGDAASSAQASNPAAGSAEGEHVPAANQNEGEPGPAVHEDDDDDAEGEDDVEVSQVENTQVEEDEENDETQVNDDSMAQKTEADEDEDNDDAEDDEEEDEDDQDEEDDDEGTAALRRGADNSDDDGEEEEDEDDEDQPDALVEDDDDEEGDEDDDDEPESARPQENGADSDDEEDEEDEDAEKDVTMDEVEPAVNDPDVENSRPASAGSRGHKRGASVVSDASGAGSNRSGIGRKRKR